MIGNQFSINFDFQKLSKICQSLHFYEEFDHLQHWTNPC